MVIMLANPIALACSAQAVSKALADRHPQLPFTTNTAPPALASQLTWLARLAHPASNTPASRHMGHGAICPRQFSASYLITTMHGSICLQAGQCVLVQCRDQRDLYILLSHTQISGAPLKLPGKLQCCYHDLLHRGKAHT